MNEEVVPQTRAKMSHVVGKASDLAPGERRIFDLDGRSVGVFNVGGQFFALHNRCPHSGGALCEGPVTGTALPTTDYSFVYGHEGRIIRCAWHGWEFEIETGQSLVDPKVRARTYRVTLEDGYIVVHMS